MVSHILVLTICFVLLAIFSAGGRLLLFYGQRSGDTAQRKFAERILNYFQDQPSRFYAAILLASTLVVIFFSYTLAALVRGLFLEADMGTNDWLRLGIIVMSFLVAGNILLLGAIYLPQRVVRHLRHRVWRFIWLPVLLVYTILFPFTWAFVTLQKSLRKNSPGIFTPWLGNPTLTTQTVTAASQVQAIQEMDIDQEILQNAIEFPSLRVRDCMIPRTDITAVDITDPIEVVKQHFIASGHSRLLVYRESVDNIVGYIHLVDLYAKPVSIEKMVMPIAIASEQMPAGDLLRSLIEKRRTIALVVDEFGGTSGLVTIEDLMEEIIGEIEDEFDVDDNTEKRISDTEFIFSARLEIEYLNETYGLGLPEGDYDTLGGLIFFVHQNIPKPGDVIHCMPFELTILSTDQARINDVRLKIVKP